MAEISLHDQMSGISGLRDILAEYGAPSSRLVDFIGYNIRDSYDTLEIGISALSVHIAKRARSHTCVVPSDEAALEVGALFAAQGVAPDKLRLLVGEIPETVAALANASFDHVVLSTPFTFPLYFAAAHAAFRLLKPGHRLTVRGSGVWTVEQLRNFLRVDPGWDGLEVISDDAIAISRQASGVTPSWRNQPYVLVNSAAMPSGIKARSQVQEAQVRSFSTTVDTLQQRKTGMRDIRRAGLVGYYGFGNYGDELFRLAFEAALPEVELPMLHDVPRRPYFIEPKTRKIERVDAVIIGGGDLIIPGYWTDFYFEPEFAQKPVFIHGVGVPRWTGGDGGIIKRLRGFFQHHNVRHINVRDAESKEWVEKYLQPFIPVDLSPDIVCGMDLGFAAGRKERGAPVFGLITRQQRADESDYRPMRALIERARGAGYRIRLIIAGNGPVGEEDYLDAQRHGLAVDEVAVAETIEENTAAITSCDALASMKFHGCVVGLMSGIPTIGMLTTDKFRSFYKMLGIERLLCHFRHAELPDCFGELAVPLPMDAIERLRDESKAGMERLRGAIQAVPRR